jgi:hypothetical protein
MRKKKNQALLPIILFSAVLLLSIGGLILAQSLRSAQIQNPSQYTHPDQVPRLTIDEAYEAVMNGEAVLFDTRSEAEFQTRHAASAVNIPINELPARLDELDSETWYITYCT